LLAGVAGGLLGLLAGTRLVTVLFIAGGGAHLPGNELALALAALAGIGVAVGWLSVPGRRMLDAPG
jgi:hypothetical protein